MDNVDLRLREEFETLQNLPAELFHKVHRDAVKVSALKKVVQREREELENKALMAPVHKLVENAHDICGI